MSDEPVPVETGQPPVTAPATPSEAAPQPQTEAARRRFALPHLTWETGYFALLLAIALGMRLWDLGGRAIHYDESLHVDYAYNFSVGKGYVHSALMHGPLKFHLIAASFKLFWDSDFTSRIPFALVGSALVVLPYFFRQRLGRAGAMIVAAMLAFSPSLLYLSRYARDDILMVFFSLALVVLAWRYFQEEKDRYLYMAAAVLALMFTTMESAFIVCVILGALFFVLGLSQIVPWAIGRRKISHLTGPAGFLVLMVTLTLPQWMPAFGLVQKYLHVTLVNMKDPFGIPQGYGYVVAFGLVVGAIIVSIYSGISWRGRKWLIAAGIYYAIWITLYTSVFTNWGSGWWQVLSHPTQPVTLGQVQPGGIASGFWESMGYWLAQHGVQRANQPWYFYFLLSTVYEFLPMLFAPAALVYYLKRRDTFGIFLAAWAFMTFFIFSYFGEKMPWIISQVALPFMVLSGKFLGDLASGIRWRTVMSRGLLTLAPLTAALLGLGVWLMYRYLEKGRLDTPSWGLLAAVLGLGAACLVLATGSPWIAWARYRATRLFARAPATSTALAVRDRPAHRLSLMALGLAGLLFGFGVYVSGLASYTYNDRAANSPVELLVYAQGSIEVRQVAEKVRDAVAQASPGGEISVDYELWYPYQWYARHDTNVRFACYKTQSEDGWASYCATMDEKLKQGPAPAAVLLNTSHGSRDAPYLTEYDRQGPYWNLLWFPQVYRIPNIANNDGQFTRLWKTAKYVTENIRRRDAWRGFWRYELTHKLGSQWWYSDFYAFLPKGSG